MITEKTSKKSFDLGLSNIEYLLLASKIEKKAYWKMRYKMICIKRRIAITEVHTIKYKMC